MPDLFDQVLRLGFRLYREFLLEKPGKCVGLCKGFIVTAMAGVELEREALPVFAQGVEAQQSFDCGDRVLAPSQRIGASCISLKRIGSYGLEAPALLPQPSLKEFFLDGNAGQKLAAEQADCPSQSVEVLACGECLQFRRIDPDGARSQPYRIGIGVDDLVRAHILAQQYEGLAKALARLLVGAVAPQKAGEMFAGGRLLRTQGEEGQQGADLPGGKDYWRKTRFMMSSGNSAEHTQDEAAPLHHLLRTNTPAPLLQCTSRRSKMFRQHPNETFTALKGRFNGDGASV